jgi:hypothetical protein
MAPSPPKATPMRRFLLVLLFCTLPLAGQAAERKYAVLSLVGDKLLIVQREMTTGSRLDRNTREFVPLPDNSIDRAVVLAVDDALRRAEPGARPVLLASRRASMYDAVDRAVDREDGTASVYEAVRPVLANSGATHLVLVTKHRNRAMLRLRDGHVGSGFLEGVGFYIDHGSYARSVDPNDAESGFIAPFTYLKVALIDVASGKVVAEERIIGSTSATSGGRNIGNVWNALSDQEKVERLTQVIREEAANAVPRVLAKR